MSTHARGEDPSSERQSDPDLTDAERAVLRAAGNGELCDLNKIDFASHESRTIRAATLHDLCLGKPVSHTRGIRIRGARIDGDINLDWETLQVPVMLDQCFLTGSLSLSNAKVKSLALTDCALDVLNAYHVRCDGDLILRSSVLEELRLDGADIGGDIDLDSSMMRNSTVAFSANLIKVSGDALIGALVCAAPILLRQASIRGLLVLAGASISTPSGTALDARGAEIGGSMILTDVDFRGSTNIRGVRVGGDLFARGAQPNAEEHLALDARRALIAGVFDLDETLMSGTVILDGAVLGGLLLRAARLSSLPVPGVVARRTVVKGDVLIGHSLGSDRIDIDLTSSRIFGKLVADIEDSVLLDLRNAEVQDLVIPTRPLARSNANTRIATIEETRGERSRKSPWLRRTSMDTTRRERIIFATALVSTLTVAGAVITLVAVMAILSLRKHPALWVIILTGSLAALGLIVASLSSSGLSTSLLLPRRAKMAARLAMEHTLAAQPVADRIGQVLAQRLMAGNLRNYTGVLSLALKASNNWVPPIPSGDFRVEANEPLLLTLTLGPQAADHSYAKDVAITGGVDAELVDFRLFVTADGDHHERIFDSRDRFTIAKGGHSYVSSLTAKAPGTPGKYLLRVELLQENRVVLATRIHIWVTPEGG